MRRSALLVALTMILASCRGEDLHLIPRSELPEDVYGRPADLVPPEGDEIPDEGTVFLVDKGRLAEVRRELPPAVSLQAALVEALLEVENPVASSDLYTAIPRNTRLLSIEVDQNIATVDLSGEFETGATGEPLALRLAQVVYTLTQEGTDILNVLFSIEGEPVPVLTGTGLVVEDPVTRQDYERFAPAPPRKPGGKASPSPAETQG